MDKMEIMEQKEREWEKALLLEYMKRVEAEERGSRPKPKGSAHQVAKGAKDKKKAKRKAARQSRKGR